MAGTVRSRCDNRGFSRRGIGKVSLAGIILQALSLKYFNRLIATIHKTAAFSPGHKNRGSSAVPQRKQIPGTSSESAGDEPYFRAL